ncbi:MAG: hypothetical protein AABW54_03580, partial [Candidatus Micrarchaeota archaeon]
PYGCDKCVKPSPTYCRANFCIVNFSACPWWSKPKVVDYGAVDYDVDGTKLCAVVESATVIARYAYDRQCPEVKDWSVDKVPQVAPPTIVPSPQPVSKTQPAAAGGSVAGRIIASLFNRLGG